MKHLAYSHAPNVSMVSALSGWIRGMLPGSLRRFPRAESRAPWKSRVLVCIGWLIVLVTQAALILLVKELITLAHGVVELYLELAGIQLDLTSQYIAATSPK